MLMGKNFAEIDAATIHSLISAGVPESVHLDFKRDTGMMGTANAMATRKFFVMAR